MFLAYGAQELRRFIQRNRDRLSREALTLALQIGVPASLLKMSSWTARLVMKGVHNLSRDPYNTRSRKRRRLTDAPRITRSRARRLALPAPPPQLLLPGPRDRSGDSRALVLYRGGQPVNAPGEKMKRAGVYQGKFRRPKKVKKPQSSITGKFEFKITQQALRCAYVGHSALPLQATLKFLGCAIVQWYLKSIRLGTTLLTSKIGAVLGPSAGSLLQFDMAVKSTIAQGPGTPEIPNLIQAVALVDDTWEDFAIRISDALIDGVRTYVLSSAAGTVAFVRQRMMFSQMAIGAYAANGTHDLPKRIINASDLILCVSGESYMQLQNRTQAETGGDEIDVVDANPLRGKVYEVNGSLFRFKEIDDSVVAGNLIEMRANAATGIIQDGDYVPIPGATGAPYSTTNFSGMVQYLTKPPRPEFFRGKVKAAYVRMEPGAIKQSRVKAVVEKSLEQWCQWLMRLNLRYESANGGNVFGPTSLESMDDGRNTVNFTKTKLYAFEKMCDTTVLTDPVTDFNNPGQITLGAEVTLFMKAWSKSKTSYSTSAVTDYKVIAQVPPP